MTVSISSVGWGSYRSYEGPFYRGAPEGRFILPTNPKEEDLILAVVTATEGGNAMAINEYDSGILSSGFIQWIEAGQYSVSAMLGKVAELDPKLLKPVDSKALDSGLEFQKNSRGHWRFFFKDERGEVDRKQEQQQMFLLHSNGIKGSWDDESKKYAKEWAVAVANVWADPRAKQVQVEYTAKRLFGFALPYARGVLSAAPNNSLGNALTAAYLSFAANNPTWANQSLEYAIKEKGADPYTLDGFIEVLKQLTFHKGITIYPHRYNAIRPVIEKLYGLDLPDFADEVKQWTQENGFAKVWDTKEVQEALIFLGFDLGPWQADGKWGNKTTEALLTFEQMKYDGAPEVPAEFVDGKMDIHTARKLEVVMEKKGQSILVSG